MTKYVGIDPGLTGAIVCIDSALNLVSVDDMPMDSKKYYDILKCYDLLRDDSQTVVAIALENTKRWSKLAQGYGILYALSTLAMNKPPMLVTPTTWQKHFKIKKADKNVSLKLVRNRWPHSDRFTRAKDHDRAEAALIAWYLRDKMEEK